ncbi:MAG: amidohydrolase [Acidobacteriota bacterium]
MAPPALADYDPSAAWNHRDDSADRAPKVLLVRGATLWTSGPEGVLENADLLVQDGRIAAVGSGLEAPAGAVVLDAAGRHVTAGLIDAHSHIATDGSVNESSEIVTSEVRIQDVVDAEDVNIYRQLAGGTTTSLILHGSANAIGGQSQVIKLRWGADAEGLLFTEAAPTIKFALGENPKRSNFDTRGPDRFPTTRPGVETILRRTFHQALDYRRQRDEAQARGAIPPAPDLRLEAVLEVIDGERIVHAHSYRSDEILMLMRVAESFDFRIGVFQHVLEGYKVADELAAHGAHASTFSDWWAYKYEVVDAIPYNAPLMRERGVVVSLNSDNADLGRRLQLEAAKMVRYGEISEEEALLFVTLNPARQLRVEERVGSLEVGKDADFVIWNGPPLAVASRVEETWIEGRRLFSRQLDLEARQRLAEERQALLTKLKEEHETNGPSVGGKNKKRPSSSRKSSHPHDHFHPHRGL